MNQWNEVNLYLILLIYCAINVKFKSRWIIYRYKLVDKEKNNNNPKSNNDKCFQYAVIVDQIIKSSNTIQKEYQKLNPLLIKIIWKKYISHHMKKIGKSLNQIITQILSEERRHAYISKHKFK